ncbi:MAG TPA: hypothetical protein VHO67_07025 [Polyangia bacterium]|nr:hypothetical protein [Polyangia bacterium]
MGARLTLLLLSCGLAVASGACGASKLDDSSGTGGSAGGATATGGHGGGGTAGSPGSVTFVMSTPAGFAFCDQLSCASTTTHLSITDAAGHAVQWSSGLCGTTDCRTCQPLLCPLVQAGLCPAPQGVVYSGGTSTWDGSYLASSTCGDAHTSCSQPQYAAPGRYLAVFCATPGEVTQPDAGYFSVCTATGTVQCVQVPFDFPSATPVQLVLRPPGSTLVP